MTFSPSSKDGDVSEEATGDCGKEVVEAQSGQATVRPPGGGTLHPCLGMGVPGGGGGGTSPMFGYGGAAGGLKP